MALKAVKEPLKKPETYNLHSRYSIKAIAAFLTGKMKIQSKMCYTHLLWMQSQGERFEQAVNRVEFTSPAYQYEGVAGYVETDVIFDVKNLYVFSQLHDEYYTWKGRDVWYADLIRIARCK